MMSPLNLTQPLKASAPTDEILSGILTDVNSEHPLNRTYILFIIKSLSRFSLLREENAHPVSRDFLLDILLEPAGIACRTIHQFHCQSPVNPEITIYAI